MGGLWSSSAEIRVPSRPGRVALRPLAEPLQPQFPLFSPVLCEGWDLAPLCQEPTLSLPKTNPVTFPESFLVTPSRRASNRSAQKAAQFR